MNPIINPVSVLKNPKPEASKEWLAEVLTLGAELGYLALNCPASAPWKPAHSDAFRHRLERCICAVMQQGADTHKFYRGLTSLPPADRDEVCAALAKMFGVDATHLSRHMADIVSTTLALVERFTHVYAAVAKTQNGYDITSGGQFKSFLALPVDRRDKDDE